MFVVGGHPKPSSPHYAVILPTRALKIVYLLKETHTKAKEGTDTEGGGGTHTRPSNNSHLSGILAKLTNILCKIQLFRFEFSCDFAFFLVKF